MAYADYAYYAGEYGGEADYDEMVPLLESASDTIDKLTFGRIAVAGFDNLTGFQQAKIKRACCLQADFMLDNADALDSSIESYAINGVSMTFGNPALYSVVGGLPVCNAALALLRATGLASGFAYPCEVPSWR